MCYAVYISTDSAEDLSVRNSELVRFENVTDPSSDPCIGLLDFSNRWYVGSKSGCSCTFRHTMSLDLGFSGPVDWYQEGEQELTATRDLYDTLTYLLSSGYHLDLIDRWEGAKPDAIITLDISLEDVSAAAFRMFENYKFRLRKN